MVIFPLKIIPVFQRIKRDKLFYNTQIKSILNRIYLLLARQIVDEYKITKGVCLDAGISNFKIISDPPGTWVEIRKEQNARVCYSSYQFNQILW